MPEQVCIGQKVFCVALVLLCMHAVHGVWREVFLLMVYAVQSICRVHHFHLPLLWNIKINVTDKYSCWKWIRMTVMNYCSQEAEDFKRNRTNRELCWWQKVWSMWESYFPHSDGSQWFVNKQKANFSLYLRERWQFSYTMVQCVVLYEMFQLKALDNLKEIRIQVFSACWDWLQKFQKRLDFCIRWDQVLHKGFLMHLKGKC
jgi:hypothetical protein